GQCNRLYPAQTLAIEGRVPPPAFSPSIQILQLDSKHGGLNFVQTEIAPELLAVVLCPKSMASQEPHARGEIGIICGDHAAVTEPAQIFGGIETEAARVPNGTGAFLIQFRPDRLGRIFNDEKIVLPRQLHNGKHVGHLAEKVDGNKNPGAGSDPGFDSIAVDIEGSRVDIYKNRPRSEPRNRTGSSEKAVWSGDDFIARPDADSHQCQQERIGAGRNADRVGRTAISSDLAFERFDFRP